MKYVLAISGGVDSCTLLDLVATNFQGFRIKNFPEAKFPDDFIVAHFEHGIRGQESKADAAFVRDLAGKYGVKFVIGEGNLPPDCNEETAREKRYEFLKNVSESCNGQIVAAHHQDDLLETIVINLIRGTNWRGLAPMTGNIARPLLNMNKAEIIAYAIDQKLDWVEEEANYGPCYFRNRVRDFLVRTDEKDRRALLELYEKQKLLRGKIEREIDSICHSGLDPESSNNCHPELVSGSTISWNNVDSEHPENSSAKNSRGFQNDNFSSISRYFLTMIDEKSALEILRFATNNQLTYPQLKTALLFAKTALPHKKLDFKKVKIRAELRSIVINLR